MSKLSPSGAQFREAFINGISNTGHGIRLFTVLFEKAKIELKVQSLKLFSDVASLSIHRNIYS